MPRNPIRRAQMVSPFGVGAMVIGQDGIGIISGGLDHWYQYEDGNQDERRLDLNEYRIDEQRLADYLGVDYFMQPPDHREQWQNRDVPNIGLTVPFLRFPQWHFCPRCRQLMEVPLTVRGRVKCQNCERQGIIRFVIQVRFISVCQHGHIQDFPWREWVHESHAPTCNKPLKLMVTGGISLGAQKVVCECGASRTLSRITDADPDGTTYLSKKLGGSEPYLCRGHRPWLGTDEREPCEQHLKGSLLSATNVYYSEVKSALYLPRGNDIVPSKLVEMMEQPPLSTLVRLLKQMPGMLTPENLRNQHRDMLQKYSDNEIRVALQIILDEPKAASNTKNIIGGSVAGEEKEITFRREEYNTLRAARVDELLMIKEEGVEAYTHFPGLIPDYFERVMLVHKLQETRALAGFTRIYTEDGQSSIQHQTRLRKHPPKPGENWLPAYKVYGEGILLELNEKKLRQWEKQPDVLQRALMLSKRYMQVQKRRRLRERIITPRFLLVHTLAHLLMNRLTFECGYSSASLRERLYVSDHELAPMAGMLIYTAEGDAEGTMGGLVRMGKPGYLEPVLQRALEEAVWCSADPVCMELGEMGGQGPDSCNGAACHNCALVPETACEEFNRFLDRAFVVGTVDMPELGYFKVNHK